MSYRSSRNLLDLTMCRHVKDLGIGLNMNGEKIEKNMFKVLGCWQRNLNVQGLRAGWSHQKGSVFDRQGKVVNT